MGIVNVTPDSFHAASRAASVEAAVSAAVKMWNEGADWVDIGGESTRPGAEPVGIEEELRRVIPVIEELRRRVPDGLISIDTRRVEVASAALAAGANMVNDVSGLRHEEMFQLVVDSGCAVCIMHMLGEPNNMQFDPHYEDVVMQVNMELLNTAERLSDSGHPSGLVIIDPGIGFGKTMQHNFDLLRAGNSVRGEENYSLLWGVSRKSIFRDLLGRSDSDERLPATLAVAAYAQQVGVDILRVHDVREHADFGRVLGELYRRGDAERILGSEGRRGELGRTDDGEKNAHLGNSRIELGRTDDGEKIADLGNSRIELGRTDDGEKNADLGNSRIELGRTDDGEKNADLGNSGPSEVLSKMTDELAD